jgi:hypothetical protein
MALFMSAFYQRGDNSIPKPSPDMSPDEVIRVQLEALKYNDNQTDAGIETAFQFTSPSNKAYIGPISRFKQLVRNPAFSILLNHQEARYEPVMVQGDVARQRVSIVGNNGRFFIYTFILSRQRGNQYRDCWMTDGVSIDAMFWLN